MPREGQPKAGPSGQRTVSGRSSRKKCTPDPFYVGSSLEGQKCTEKSVLVGFCSFPHRRKLVQAPEFCWLDTVSQEKRSVVSLSYNSMVTFYFSKIMFCQNGTDTSGIFIF